MSNTPRTSAARQRILETADRLFYGEGIHAVGIDRIIAEAEVAKMTLYKHFRSKDELVLAVLRYREEQIVGFFESAIARHQKKGLNRLEALFAALKEWFESPAFRGCAFINACVELADPSHPASQFVVRHKRSFREMLAGIVAESAGAKGVSVVPAISVLVEGAIVTAVMQGNSDAADVAKEAAMTLIAKAKRTRTS